MAKKLIIFSPYILQHTKRMLYPEMLEMFEMSAKTGKTSGVITALVSQSNIEAYEYLINNDWPLDNYDALLAAVQSANIKMLRDVLKHTIYSCGSLEHKNPKFFSEALKSSPFLARKEKCEALLEYGCGYASADYHAFSKF